MNDNEHFSTSDIILAAYLKLNDCPLIRIDKEGAKGTFIFTNVTKQLVDTFDIGEAKVEPMRFNQTIKALNTAVKR